MSLPRITGVVFLLCGLVYAFVLGRDLVKNREALRSAPGDWKLLAPLEADGTVVAEARADGSYYRLASQAPHAGR